MNMRFIFFLTCFFVFTSNALSWSNQFDIEMKPKEQHFWQPKAFIPRTNGDTMEDPFEISVIPSVINGSTIGFNNDYDVACPYDGSIAADVVYRLVLEQEIRLDLDLCGSSYDTKIYVMNEALEVLFCNDDAYFNDPCGVYVSRLVTGLLNSGQEYFVIVDGYGDSEGDFTLAISEFLPYEDCNFDLWWARDEGEPALKPGYVDVFNGGCQGDPQNFYSMDFYSMYYPTINGKTGWLMEGQMDKDWYSFVFYGYTNPTITLTAPFRTALYHITAGDCENYEVIESVISDNCQPASIEFQTFDYEDLQWFVVIPLDYNPDIPDMTDYDYLLEITSGTGSARQAPLPESADTGFGCPRLIPGTWMVMLNLNSFNNNYDFNFLDCYDGNTPGGDSVVEFYLEDGHTILGRFSPLYIDSPVATMGRSFPTCIITDDLRLGEDACFLRSLGVYNQTFSFTAPKSGFYYFVTDFDGLGYPGLRWSFGFHSSPPEPPANNTCSGAELLALGSISIQGDLTTAWNTYDTGYQCDQEKPDNYTWGDTGRDIVYQVNLVAGQVLDLRMESIGQWDELMYLISDCDNPTESCLAISKPEGDGVRLIYTASNAESIWLICDSWGAGDRPFDLSGFIGSPAPVFFENAFESGLACFPNPFNPQTRISFSLSKGESVKVEFFSLDGKRVKVLVDGFLPSGHHFFDWDGTDENNLKVAAGVYFCRLSTSTRESTTRLMLLK